MSDHRTPGEWLSQQGARGYLVADRIATCLQYAARYRWSIEYEEHSGLWVVWTSSGELFTAPELLDAASMACDAEEDL